MNALLYSKSQQPQAWHESLEMIFDIVVRFNIQTLRTKCNPIPSIEHALNYISIILVGFDKWIDVHLAETSESRVWGYRWKYKRKLLTHINVEACIEAQYIPPLSFIPSSSSLSLTCLIHSFNCLDIHKQQDATIITQRPTTMWCWRLGPRPFATTFACIGIFMQMGGDITF